MYVDSRQRLPLTSKLVREAGRLPTVVITGQNPNNRLTDAGVTVLQVAESEGRPDPKAALVYLRRGCEASDAGDRATICNLLVDILAGGDASVRDPAEARSRIQADQCSIAKPVDGKQLRGDRLYCGILAEMLLDGVAAYLRAPGLG